jgi:hypothetical protein
VVSIAGKGFYRKDNTAMPEQRNLTYLIEMSKAVYKVRIRGTWYLAEVTAKARKPLIKAGIDYLNEAE